LSPPAPCADVLRFLLLGQYRNRSYSNWKCKNLTIPNVFLAYSSGNKRYSLRLTTFRSRLRLSPLLTFVHKMNSRY
jgi:hypothetical protein